MDALYAPEWDERREADAQAAEAVAEALTIRRISAATPPPRRPSLAYVPQPGPAAPEYVEAVRLYLAECRRRNLSLRTQRTYSGLLLGGTVADFIEHHPIATVTDIDLGWLRAFQTDAMGRMRAISVLGYMRVLAQFLRFCIDEGWMPDCTDVLKLKRPIVPKHSPTVITEDEEQRLLAACRCERDRFLIRFLIRTGVRLAELVSLTIDDLEQLPQGWAVRVRQGKGRKDRLVPLDTGGCRFSDDVLDYVKRIRPRRTGGSSALFVTARRYEKTYVPLTYWGAYILVRRLAEGTGIHVHPHALRHTFATRAAASGVEAFALQAVLGHTTLAMTNRYVQYSSTAVMAAWQRRQD